ncbi:MAG: hypothetical protein KJO43_02445 [Phycisphaerae bacterium]|nr:hypothetical protein [Phycisphaerae bacterium]
MCGIRPLILCATLFAAALSGPGVATDPFARAVDTPSDISLYVHVENTGELRAAVATRPVAAVFHRMLREAGPAWATLTRQAGVDPLDVWLQRRVTLMVREDGPRRDWLLLTEIDVERHRRLERRLRPRRLAPVGSFAIAELPEHAIRWAQTGERELAIGPMPAGRLMNEHLRRRHRGVRPDRALGDHESLTRLRRRPGDTIGVFVRHAALMGGWSIARARIEADRVQVRHAARFDHTPFRGPVATTDWDISPLAAFRPEALGVLIEPVEAWPESLDGFVQATLGVPLLSAAMRANRRDCQVITFGEVEGRLEAQGVDQLLPAAALAIRIRNRRGALDELDDHLIRFSAGLDRLQPAEALVPPPVAEAGDAQTFRHVDLRRWMHAFAPEQPLLQSVGLSWAVASGGQGSFYVIATHPEQLARTVTAIEEAAPGPPDVGRWAGGGCLDGGRVGRHLRSYADEAARLAVDDPEAVDALRETFLTLSDLAAGFDWCQWRLKRPCERTMHLDVELELRPGVSDAAGPEKKLPREP